MKQALKIIGYALLSIVGIVGAAVGIIAINNDFGVKYIEISQLSFETNNVLVIEDFFTKLTYSPADATELDVKLSIEKGHNIVRIPESVKAGSDFKIEILQDIKGNNVGGEVIIKAKTDKLIVDENFRFYVDVAIPLEGLKIESDIYDEKVATGSGEFSVYVFTDPWLALFPDSSIENTQNLILNEYTYKNINLTSTDNSSLKIIPSSKKLLMGYYNPDYRTNGKPVFSAVRINPTDIQRRYIQYSVSPISTSGENKVQLVVNSLRTYAMQKEFVNIDSYGDNSQIAYRDFSAYLEKFRSYIEADTRAVSMGAYNFANGSEFIARVTENGQKPVTIIEQNAILHQIALRYLYLENTIVFDIQNIKIKEIKAKDDLKIELFEEYQLNATELRTLLGIELVPTEQNATSNSLISKISDIKLSAYKGIDTDGDGLLDRTEDNKIILVPANDMIAIENPTNLQNPIWKIRALNPQITLNDGLVIRITIEQDGQTLEKNGHVKVTIEEKSVGGITLKDDFFPTLLSTNKNLTNGIVNSVRISDNSNNQVYELVNPNATYNVVKFFVKRDSVMVDNFKAIRLSEDYLFEELEIIDMYTGETYRVFEVTYSQIEALNVTQTPVVLFAAVIQTNFNGDPLYREDNKSYIIVQKSNEVSFTITSYIEELYYYTVLNDESGNSIYTKRSAEVIKLLSNQIYTIYLSNMELDSYGNFDSSAPQYSNTNIHHKHNLTHALRTHAGYAAGDPYNIRPHVTSDASHEGVLSIYNSGSQKLYVYNQDRDIIELSLIIQRRDNLITTQDKVIKNTLYFDYILNKPLNLDTRSRASVDIVFAEIEGDLLLSNTIADYTPDNIVQIQAGATDGSITWKHSGNIFSYLDLSYVYDILKLNDEGVPSSSKIDSSLRDIQFIEDYINYIEEYHLTITWQVISGNEYISIQPRNNGKKIDINFLKGTVSGAEAKIVVTLSLYPDNTGRALQTKSQVITFNIQQSKPEATLFSLRLPYAGGKNNPDNFEVVEEGEGEYSFIDGRYEKTGDYINRDDYANNYIYIDKHLIPNTRINPHVINGTQGLVNILGDLDDALPVYTYDIIAGGLREGFKNITETVSNFMNKRLINVYLDDAASIAAGSTFSIESDSTGDKPAYFIVNGEKVYSAKPTRNADGELELNLATDNIIQETALRIKITTSTGQSFDYYILVDSNLEINIPTGNIATIDDSNVGEMAFDLNGTAENSIFKATQTLVNEKVISLPISFELKNEQSKNYSELLDGKQTYNVGFTNSGADHLANSGVVFTSNGLEKQTFKNRLSIFQILEQKNINVNFYYYIPRIDANGDFELAGTVDGKTYPLTKTATGYTYTMIDEISGEETVVSYPSSSNTFFIFDKRQYLDGAQLGAIVVNPTKEVVKGQNAPSKIRVSSGSTVNLFKVVLDNAADPTTTNFIDVRNIANKGLIGDFADFDGNLVYDYSDVYNQYFHVELQKGEYNEYQNELFIQLGATIVKGIINSNSINGDLTLKLAVRLKEGQTNNGTTPPTHMLPPNSELEFEIIFENNVNFDIDETITFNGNDVNYVTQIDSKTLKPIGYVFEDIMSPETDTIVLEPKLITLYDYSASAQNIISLLGGSNEDLLRSNIDRAKLYQFNGTTFVPIADTDNSVVELQWNKSGSQTNRISLILSGSVNHTTKYKLMLESDRFELGDKAELFFEIHPNIMLENNYPIFSDYERVVNGTVVNLNKNYINEQQRTQIVSYDYKVDNNGQYVKDYRYNYVGEGQGAYKAVEFAEVREDSLGDGQIKRYGDYSRNGEVYEYVGRGNGNYIATKFDFVGIPNGAYRQVDTNQFVLDKDSSETKYALTRNVYELELLNEFINLVNIKTNEKIRIVHANNSSNEVNFFTYYLLNQSKTVVSSHSNVVGTFPRVVRSNNLDGIEFRSITNSTEMYVRIELYNKAFIDYKIQLVPNNTAREQFTLRDNLLNPVTEDNPIVVKANTEFSLLNNIIMSNGSVNNLLIKYNYDESTGVGAIQGEDTLNQYNYLNINQKLKFDNVNQNKLVSFDIYGKNYTAGTVPTKLYIRVEPNFGVDDTRSKTQVPAGNKVNLVYWLNNDEINPNGIFALVGDVDRVDGDVTYDIIAINGQAFNNQYNAKIVKEGPHSEWYLLVDDISSSIELTICITKKFDANKELKINKTITVQPNITVTRSYNQSTKQTITPSQIGEADITFSTQDKLTIKNKYGVDIVNVADHVTILYAVYTMSNQVLSTEQDINQYGISGFSTSNGSFTVLKVNQIKQFKVKTTIIWKKNAATGASYDPAISYEADYFVEIQPNINVGSINVTYRPAGRTSLLVQEGSTVELHFDKANESFASQANTSSDIRIAAAQNGTEPVKPNFVLIATDNDYYRIFSLLQDGNTKYYIEFKNLTSASNKVVEIPLYLDLTKNSKTSDYYGVVTTDEKELYKTTRVVRFEVTASLGSFVIKPEYEQNQTTPLNVDFGAQFKLGAGGFNFEDGVYKYVEGTSGSHNLERTNQRYMYVGQGNGNYKLTDGVYEYVEQGNGDYALLAPNQYDLFDMISTAFIAGANLSFTDSDVTNPIVVNQNVLRNSIQYSVAAGQENYVSINNGIASFKPFSIQRTVDITFQLYGNASTAKTIKFSIGAGGVAILTEGTIDNPIQATVGSTLILSDKIIYGYTLSDYTTPAESVTITTDDINDDGYASVVKIPNGSNDRVIVLVKLDTPLTYYVQSNSDYVNMNNGVLTFNDWEDDDDVKIITIKIVETGQSIYISLTKAP